MAIEITPKSKLEAPIWAITLLVIGLVLIAGLVISYLYLGKFIKELSESIEEKERALREIPSEEQAAMENELLLHEAKINSFKDLLSEHKKVENTFSFLEKVSHPRVWFTDFDFDSEREVITVSGRAESFVAVEQQLLILKGESLLKNIKLSEISMGQEGGIAFALRLTLDPQIFE